MATKQCPNNGEYRYTWAGKNESIACEEHAKQIKGVGDAMGYYVQMIPLITTEQCRNQIADTENKG